VADTPITVLRSHGGCVSAAELIARCGRRALRTAVALGDLVRARRGLYVAAGLSDAQVAAAQVRGVVSHQSAASILGLSVAVQPDQPHVTVPRHRHLARARAHVHWADLGADESLDGVTTALRTVVDCARTLPFGEALVIADSALAQGKVARVELRDAAAAVRAQGRAAAMRVAEAADRRAESPLESLVRALTLEAGMHAVPQATVTDDAFFARVDLADLDHGIVVEADSYRHHATREGFERDCERYDELAVRGFLVLRSTWRQVMNDPEWVTRTLVAAMGPGRARRTRSRRPPAPMARAA
jgi:very-short-patch-repair endonuclease